MRFKSKPTNGYQVFAVSGVNTISFGINASDGRVVVIEIRKTERVLGFTL